MSIAAIVIALVVAVVAFKFLKGMIKLVVIVGVIALAAWFFMGGAG